MTSTRDELPTLPDQHDYVVAIGDAPVFTADQMHEYARTALSSAHQAQAEPDEVERLKADLATYMQIANDMANSDEGWNEAIAAAVKICEIHDMGKMEARHCRDAIRALARPSQAQEPSELVPDPGDWPEDAAQENGNYENHCRECGQTFSGNKHRRVCKVCTSKPVSGAVDEPLEVFDKGPWRWEETGQLFSGEELDAAAFSVYRAHLQRYDVREKALNALLWFYRRAKPTYGRLPFAEEAIAALSHPAAAPVSEQITQEQSK